MEGKYCRCLADCFSRNSSREMGSWAHWWKILPACSQECSYQHRLLRSTSSARLVCAVFHTSGPGRPCNCALIFHGRSGLPYSCKISFVHIVYRSSESMSRPSISKRQARIGGRLVLWRWRSVVVSFARLTVERAMCVDLRCFGRHGRNSKCAEKGKLEEERRVSYSRKIECSPG